MLAVFYFALIPFATFVCGGLLASVYKPSETWQSIIQHFASGVICAVVAVDLLPDIVKTHSPLDVAIGFIVGVILMLIIRTFAEKAEEAHEALLQNKEAGVEVKMPIPLAMLGAVGVDVVVDGFLIGVLLTTSHEAGKFLTMALGLEMFSLGMALAVSLTASMRRLHIVVITVLLAATVVLSACVSSYVIGFLPVATIPILLSFGLAALLYLVIEELLHEAHQLPDNSYITSTFFIGFLLFLLLSMMH